jgi:hypothetical protein
MLSRLFKALALTTAIALMPLARAGANGHEAGLRDDKRRAA